MFCGRLKGDPPQISGALCVQLFPSLLFCSVNSSCLSHQRFPILLALGNFWLCLGLPHCAKVWKLSSVSKKGQIQVSSFLFLSLRDHYSVLTYSVSENHCFIYFVRLFGCFRQKGKSRVIPSWPDLEAFLCDL